MSLATRMSESENVLRGKKLAFLVGAPRSGTKWLQLLLSRPPSVATTQEMHLFNLFTHSMIEHWNCDPRTRSLMGLTNLLSEEEYQTLLPGVSAFVFAKIAQVEHGARELMSELGYAPANGSKAMPALVPAGWDAWRRSHERPSEGCAASLRGMDSFKSNARSSGGRRRTRYHEKRNESPERSEVHVDSWS